MVSGIVPLSWLEDHQLKAENISEKKEEAPAQTSSTPAAGESKKPEEKTVDEKKDSEPALAAPAPVVEQSKEATLTTEVAKEEKKPETTTSTPASFNSFIFLSLTPPSTSIKQFGFFLFISSFNFLTF